MEEFRDVHVSEMRRYPERRIVLLIDFDGRIQRLSYVKGEIPSDLSDRVFVLGVLSEPERLKKSIGMTLEQIGKALAQDCVDETRSVWAHALLTHNETELDLMDRTNPSVRQVLFS